MEGEFLTVCNLLGGIADRKLFQIQRIPTGELLRTIGVAGVGEVRNALSVGGETDADAVASDVFLVIDAGGQAIGAEIVASECIDGAVGGDDPDAVGVVDNV